MGENQTYRVRCSPPLLADGSIEIEEIGADQLLVRFVTPGSLELGQLRIQGFGAAIDIDAVEFLNGQERALITSSSRETLRDLLARIRKNQHIDLCRDNDVEASDRINGFENLCFVPRTIPKSSSVQLRRNFLGRDFAMPILITGMTGGVEKGAQINRNLALAASKHNIPMGVGSQRMAIDDPKLRGIFAVKDQCPDIFLIGNLGIGQLTNDFRLEKCLEAVSMIEADALAIHVNIVQELVQVEGDRSFDGFFKNLKLVCQELSVPVIVKEVGCGMDRDSLAELVNSGVAAIDIGGRGGTSWSRIEGLRGSSRLTARLGEGFRNWGIPTAYSLAAARRAVGETYPLIATGGIRDGMTVAKAVALGATMVGIGLPLFRAALRSAEAVDEELEALKLELTTTIIATGHQDLSTLHASLTHGQPYEEELRQRIRELHGN